MQRIDLKESDWRSSIAKAKAMDWLIRHRVAGKSSVAVDNYVEKLCTHSCEVERHPGPTSPRMRQSVCQCVDFLAARRTGRRQQVPPLGFLVTPLVAYETDGCCKQCNRDRR